MATDQTIATNKNEICRLYRELLESWNKQNAHGMATLFSGDGSIVGFDGSQYNGKIEIEAEISSIFANHQTAAFVGIVREVRFLAPDVAILRAVAGMVPPGRADINPATNAIQSLIVHKVHQQDGIWRVALFQNTPAQFHGRPELAQNLTDELQKALRTKID